MFHVEHFDHLLRKSPLLPCGNLFSGNHEYSRFLYRYMSNIPIPFNATEHEECKLIAQQVHLVHQLLRINRTNYQ
jgi:hypothetical protein